MYTAITSFLTRDVLQHKKVDSKWILEVKSKNVVVNYPWSKANDNELHACSVITIISSYRIEDLQVKLYEVTEIDKEDQELLAYSGKTVELTTPVMDICKKSSQVRKKIICEHNTVFVKESV